MSFFEPTSEEFAGIKQAAKRFRAARKSGAGVGFGRFAYKTKDVPTINELGIIDYLRSQGLRKGVDFVTNYNLMRDYPHEEFASGRKHQQLEADVYFPKTGLIIEASPGWHYGARALAYTENPKASKQGRKNILRVIRDDFDKAELASKHGLTIETVDPKTNMNEFARQFNANVLPALREAGYNVAPWYVESPYARLLRKTTQRKLARLKK